MMGIRIYQINLERDKHKVYTLSCDQLEDVQGFQIVDSQIYDKVYTGAVDCSDLNGVYHLFNTDPPTDYSGRSLNVSDVVEVISAEGIEPGFYFRDSVGFTVIFFEPRDTQNAIHTALKERMEFKSIEAMDEWVRTHSNTERYEVPTVCTDFDTQWFAATLCTACTDVFEAIDLFEEAFKGEHRFMVLEFCELRQRAKDAPYTFVLESEDFYRSNSIQPIPEGGWVISTREGRNCFPYYYPNGLMR